MHQGKRVQVARLWLGAAAVIDHIQLLNPDPNGVALYSHQPYQWVTIGPNADQEFAAPGLKISGFVRSGAKQWMEAISTAPLSIKGLQIEYTTPGVGKTQFAWQGEFCVNGEQIPLDGYPRWENPYLNAEFGTPKFNIAFNGMRLELDFENGLRQDSDAR
jgi:hypothetical protein